MIGIDAKQSSGNVYNLCICLGKVFFCEWYHQVVLRIYAGITLNILIRFL